jgi:hypothetical protein
VARAFRPPRTARAWLISSKPFIPPGMTMSLILGSPAHVDAEQALAAV